MGWAGGQSPGSPSAGAPEFQAIFCCMGVLCTWVKLLTDLQIWGCELHKNAFGGRAPPGPAGGAIAVIREGKERVGNREGEEGKGREGHEGVGRDNASTTIYRMKRVAHIDCRA